MTQLVLDVTAGLRVRDGRWPREAHQRGWVRLPWACAVGAPWPDNTARKGDVVPAWVCCGCGGVDVGWHALDLNHGCCTLPSGCWSLQRQAEFADRGAPIEPYRPFDALWLPVRPGRAA